MKQGNSLKVVKQGRLPVLAYILVDIIPNSVMVRDKCPLVHL